MTFYPENLPVAILLLGSWAIVFVTVVVTMIRMKSADEIIRSQDQAAVPLPDQNISIDKVVNLNGRAVKIRRLADSDKQHEMSKSEPSSYGPSSAASGGSASASVLQSGHDH